MFSFKTIYNLKPIKLGLFSDSYYASSIIYYSKYFFDFKLVLDCMKFINNKSR